MLIRGDARTLPLRDGCVQTCITSPPFWGLRDYQVAGQLGLEETPEQYAAGLVAVFREVWRVLRADGTLWLNLGDSYAAQRGGTEMPAETLAGGVNGKATAPEAYRGRGFGRDGRHGGLGDRLRYPVAHRNAAAYGLKHKDLVGIPWRVAFALQADGWYLRSDIIWSKPNPMPESVIDRVTRAHEYVFLLSKAARYYYDADAIREPAAEPGRTRTDVFGGASWVERQQHSEGGRSTGHTTRNKRSVWTIATEPYPGSHFATFPEALVEPCILAGCPMGGVVLDPFCGTFTVGAVAARLGRRAVGVDLHYQELARERTQQRGLFVEAATSREDEPLLPFE